jgi:hypothetical protein
MIATFNGNITVTATPTSLYALIAAINANAMRNCSKVEIQGDDTNTQNFLVGDSQLSTSNYAFVGRTAADVWMDESQNDHNLVSITTIYLRSVSGSQVLHVRVRCV